MQYHIKVKMKQIIVNVPDKKFSFFIELVRSLGFTDVKEKGVSTSKKEALKGIEQGLREVKMIQEGKLPKRKIEDLLNEL